MARSPFLLCLLLACAVLVTDRRCHAQQPQVINREYEIKAGYFAYFGSLIRWPATAAAKDTFVIGVLGSNPFRQHLHRSGNDYVISAGRVNASNIQGKKIRVIEYSSVADFQRNYNPCHILYIASDGVGGESAESRVQAALAKTKGQSVLLVAEGTSRNASLQMARSGVMICYWNDVASRQVRMFINRAAEKREGLAISSRLLGLGLVEVL